MVIGAGYTSNGGWDRCYSDETIPLANLRRNGGGNGTYATNGMANGMTNGNGVGNGIGHGTMMGNGSSNSNSNSNSSSGSGRSGRSGHSGHSGRRYSYPSATKKSFKKNDVCATTATIVVSITAIVLCVVVLVPWSGVLGRWSHSESDGSAQASLFDDIGRYVVEDYDAKAPFSDFLPGVAGIYGKPLWAFFVNRGQGIASFGIESKDFPILEFNSANKAYQTTPLVGFRTFLKGQRGRKQFLFEPFARQNTRFEGTYGIETAFTGKSNRLPKRTMYIGANEMQIREVDFSHGIETNVTYFVLPEEDFGAFVRRTTISNIDKKHPVTISLLDGLARLEPAGGKLNDKLKMMGRTLEAWMGVYQPYDDTLTMPFYKLSTQPSDSASIRTQMAGHYALSVLEGKAPTLLPIVYDTAKIFGDDSMLFHPVRLHYKTVKEIIEEPQYGFAKTSSAFGALEAVTLQPGESVSIATFFGKTEKMLDVPVISRRLTMDGFVTFKLQRTRELIKQITAGVETDSGDDLFDKHVGQMFLDNSLRGGIPQIVGEVGDLSSMKNTDEDSRLKVFHLFSRVHGDLERDYNNFKIESTFFSQGPGNFRDVLQNRRNDVIFTPRIGSYNVKMFLSLIQADGYEPLSVEAVAFTIPDVEVCARIATEAVGHADGVRAQREQLTAILNAGPFRPGQLFQLMEELHIILILPRHDFIEHVAAAANVVPMAVSNDAEGGYWSDHWDYYMDIIQTYLSIYPDGEEAFLFNTEVPYYYSAMHVQPRRRKYVLSRTDDGNGYHVRQLGATIDDVEKHGVKKQFFSNETGLYELEANWQHAVGGTLFKSCAIAKLLLLATLKFATRDPYGMGIEMEAGRPGWNDAMNGLVGLLGSGMPETFELKILLRYVETALAKFNRLITVPKELGTLVREINENLAQLDGTTTRGQRKEEEGSLDGGKLSDEVPPELFHYWDQVSSARERYREATKLTFSGETVSLRPSMLVPTLQRWIEEVDKGIERALLLGTTHHKAAPDEPNDNEPITKNDTATSSITPTYFSFTVTGWHTTGELSKEGHEFVEATKMKVDRLPLFLEGPVRQMKSVPANNHGIDPVNKIYLNVKRSPLRDSGLGMYTLSESLESGDMRMDIGRMKAFAAGWLENQSVWMHMSYKFYLELLRHGLFEAFFDEMKSGGLLPFMDPSRYGRPVVQCSSFIASSAFEDPALRGRGFLARLSGATAEFLSMWTLMMIGPEPFYVNSETGELRMQLLPALPRWLFKEGGVNNLGDYREQLTIDFKLFSFINVKYVNSRKTDLFGAPPTWYEVGLRDGSVHTVRDTSIPQDLADKIRRVVFVDYIIAFFE